MSLTRPDSYQCSPILYIGLQEEITLSDLACLQVEVIDPLLLKERGLVSVYVKTVKVIKSGRLTKAVKLTGVVATAGARLAIEAAGGSIV